MGSQGFADCGAASGLLSGFRLVCHTGKRQAMTLNQALTVINSRRDNPERGTYYLACGFQPLHLVTLLRAHLLEQMPAHENLEVRHGVYGDLRGNIETAASSTDPG